MDLQHELRKLPKIDRLAESDPVRGWIALYGRDPVFEALRREVDLARKRVQSGEGCPPEETIVASVGERLEREARPSLVPVINATGVVLHTNLGRAPISEEAIAAMAEVARGYSNLEFDLDAGARGSRYGHCDALLAQLTGAEAGLVVNNNASSVLLLLSAFASGRQVVVSRGQLVEIGGGFRIPDVMRASGAELVEVGTTNRTYAADYEQAIGEQTAALMVVHPSNFQLLGFTHEPQLSELAELSRRRGVLLIDDLGSGTLLDTARYGLAHEPTVQERIAAGADLVCFSGDKLLGGPQAGFIVGRRELIDRLKRFPMLRALRVDKVGLAGIEATLRHYQRGDATEKIPIWRAISAPLEQLAARAEKWRSRLKLETGVAEVVRGESAVGGGSLPGRTLPTWLLAIRRERVDEFAKRLRTGERPVVARIEEGRLLFDPRTVMPHEDEVLVEALQRALSRD